MEIITNILAVIGGGVIILTFINLLFNLTPKLSQLKSYLSNKFAEKIKHKRLEKLAIKNNIEEIVNETVRNLSDELPKGWINKASIEWIKGQSASNIKENEIILRMKPFESQDFNLINGIYFFFCQSLFPKTKEVIPTNVCKSAALQISIRTLSKNQSYLIPKFEQEFLEKEIQNDKTILNYYGKYQKLDSQGFFSGIFIREISNLAELSRYTEVRNNIDKEIDYILEHLINFQVKRGADDDNIWYRTGPANSYAFMLVARPFHKSMKPYLKRARQRIDDKIDRLYILGCNQEIRFVRKVIHSISSMTDYDLAETFSLHKDYRGENNGIGALLVNQK